jgi:HSP20 family protein
MANTIVKRQTMDSPETFGNVVDNIFQNSIRRFFDDNFRDRDGRLSPGAVPVNVRETEKQYEVDLIAPGCRKEDFLIRMDGNQLTVSFDHQEEKRQQDEKTGWSRNEYVQRSFSRAFSLDDTVDAGNIHAAYTDGILHLILPKNEKAKKLSRTIDVK